MTTEGYLTMLVMTVVGRLGTDEVGVTVSAPAGTPEEGLSTAAAMAAEGLRYAYPGVVGIQPTGWVSYEVPEPEDV